MNMGAAHKISKLYEGGSLSGLVQAVVQRGVGLLERAGYTPKTSPAANLRMLCQLLVTTRGEAFGMAAAQEALTIYEGLEAEGRLQFFQWLMGDFYTQQEAVAAAAQRYLDAPTTGSLRALREATRPQVQQLLERLNEAPGAMLKLVRMREDAMALAQEHREIGPLDAVFAEVFTAWFNKGFLELRRIDWQTPAETLEKIIRYEAVHAVQGWEDLRRRIAPGDRCLYAFFHPQLANEPLIFVEVALSAEVPVSIQAVLSSARESTDSARAKVATFYSISNCHMGLKGIPLGSFLIKRVVSDLKARFGSLESFVTLSPVPGLRRWLGTEEAHVALGAERVELLLAGEDETGLASACAYYLSKARDKAGRPLDAVARFHLGNGARLEQINVRADVSEKGRAQSLGVMVNYLYALKDIEANHEAYVNHGSLAVARGVQRLADEVASSGRESR